MLGRLWPRFALEACFLIVVAVVAGLLDLSLVAIIVVMAVAYGATVALEWTAARVRSSPESAAEPVAAAPALQADGVVAVTVHPSESAWEREQAEDEDEVQEPELTREPEPEPEPVVLVVAPPPEPEPVVLVVAAPVVLEPAPVAEEPEPVQAAVSTLPLPVEPQEWNLWELERLVRDAAGADPVRDEELSYLLHSLREFASPDGVLPVDFDALVRESFGEIVAARVR